MFNTENVYVRSMVGKFLFNNMSTTWKLEHERVKRAGGVTNTYIDVCLSFCCKNQFEMDVTISSTSDGCKDCESCEFLNVFDRARCSAVYNAGDESRNAIFSAVDLCLGILSYLNQTKRPNRIKIEV